MPAGRDLRGWESCAVRLWRLLARYYAHPALLYLEHDARDLAACRDAAAWRLRFSAALLPRA